MKNHNLRPTGSTTTLEANVMNKAFHDRNDNERGQQSHRNNGVDVVVVTMGVVVVVVAMDVAESTTKATIITVRTKATKGV